MENRGGKKGREKLSSALTHRTFVAVIVHFSVHISVVSVVVFTRSFVQPDSVSNFLVALSE